jgi:hypothetical protein
MVEAKLIEAETGNGLIAAKIRAGKTKEAYDMFIKSIESSDKVDAELEKQRTIFEEKKALKMTPSGAKMGGGGSGKRKIEQLPAQLEKKLDDIGTTFATLNRTSQTMKPQYFGVAPSDDVANLIIAGVERGLDVGSIMQSLGSKAPKVTTETVNWWKDYNGFVAQVRNKLFGATLTPREAEDFRKFTLSPATSPNIAANYFDNQLKIIRTAVERERRKASARNVSDETISAYLDLPQDDAAAPAAPTNLPRINTKEEFDALAPGTEFIDAQDGKRYRKPAAR